jgi:carboxymethylenebutenolidase
LKDSAARSSLGFNAPCVIVLHEVWGPDSHLDDVCKRVRKLGFATAVPNLYEGHEELLTPHNIQKAMEAAWDLSLEERRDKKKVSSELARKGADSDAEDVLSVLYDQRFRDRMLEITLQAVRDARQKHRKTATLGFSLGGGLSLAAATKTNPPDSAIAYCGEPPRSQSLRSVSVPMLAIYANHDDLINPKVPAFVEAALMHGNDLTVKTFSNTRHDFFNKTRNDFNRAAAEEAWSITASFLARTLE